MSDPRSLEGQRGPDTREPRGWAPVRDLLRMHTGAPHDRVDWDRLATRTVAGAGAELARRRARTGRPWGAQRRRRGAWWEVAAGWVRPATAAAAVAALAAVVIGTPVVPTGGSAGDTAATGASLAAAPAAAAPDGSGSGRLAGPADPATADAGAADAWVLLGAMGSGDGGEGGSRSGAEQGLLAGSAVDRDSLYLAVVDAR